MLWIKSLLEKKRKEKKIPTHRIGDDMSRDLNLKPIHQYTMMHKLPPGHQTLCSVLGVQVGKKRHFSS